MDRPAGLEKFYVTTPIYYVNDVPHIGHAYTTVAADCVARYRRLKGCEVLFLTGTDEHGQKVEKAASNAGVGPIEFADRVVVRFEELWEALNISNDDFIRTTEERHRRAAARLWETVASRGDIYLGEYEDWYCTPCESFLTETQLKEGKCPDCGRAVDRLREPSYFFRLSRYAVPLLEHISKNPDFIRPEGRRNEIVSFIKEGLRDLSVSRTTFSWGIPVPDGPGHVMYVWFDALANYLTATGYPDSLGNGFWPADLHLIGKDILRFHAVYWPAFLMSAGLPLPRSVFAHGWWTVDGNKMSKSKGNVVDPVEVIERFGVDQFRYFLLREVPFGLDGDFSLHALKGRVNSDLANDLGNLLSRSVTMIEKYCGGVVPGPAPSENPEPIVSMIRDFNRLPGEFDGFMDSLRFSDALLVPWRLISALNGYIESSAPWKMAKEGADAPLSNVLHTLAEGLRIIALYLYPFMPGSAEKIWEQLGMGRKIESIDNLDVEIGWDGSGDKAAGNRVNKGPVLFPRIDGITALSPMGLPGGRKTFLPKTPAAGTKDSE